MTGLGGTGRLADDLYLLAHHEATGKPHLQPRALGQGLAAGLLAELLMAEAIRVGRGSVVAAGGLMPGDDVSGLVARRVASEPEPLPVRDWLAFLGQTAARDVARRLEWAGYLTHERCWRGERWVPVDADCAFAPLTRIGAVLRPSGLPGLEAARHLALAGLAVACGLGHQLWLYLPPDADQRLGAALQWLDPGLRELIAETQAAVDSALLSHRV
ncbi:MAG TPA: GPP34 family phosphoprotein [Streptosporangiaceae bacterium]|nr:GPP34 family phosphoprotein [Streptosporangiaceae bacterium]